jgi:hypothetical protein
LGVDEQDGIVQNGILDLTMHCVTGDIGYVLHGTFIAYGGVVTAAGGLKFARLNPGPATMWVNNPDGSSVPVHPYAVNIGEGDYPNKFVITVLFEPTYRGND